MPVKRHFQLLLFALIALISYSAVKVVLTSSSSYQQSARLPDVYFYDKLGRKITLEKFKGKTVLVNLWASWCPPCVAELPALDRLQQKLPKNDFVVVAISLDAPPLPNVEKFLRSKGIKHLDVYTDKDRQMPLKWQYAGLPTSFLIGANGSVIKKYEGAYTWDRGATLEEVRATVKPVSASERRATTYR